MIPESTPSEESVTLWVSACLMGESTRYDGTHKLFHHIPQILGGLCTVIPVCPEAEAGYGTPREPMHLSTKKSSPRLLTNAAGVDITEKMELWIPEAIERVALSRPRGFILKARSPSCHVQDSELSQSQHSGLFTQAVVRRFPSCVVVNETLLQDSAGWRDFICRLGCSTHTHQALLNRVTTTIWKRLP
ncbi:MAG: DUF523 domain-containing protein [Magnetococcales bacterium]|nr:DUF523 domain-containing protein [Magnetococcales bacterium]